MHLPFGRWVAVLSVFVAGSLAAGLAHAAVSPDDQPMWVSAVAGEVISQDIVVDRVQPFHFWSFGYDVTDDAGNPANGYSGGYIGIQNLGSTPAGTVARSAVFSIWSGTSPDDANCDPWNGGGEGGTGVSCRVAFSWVTGQPVTVKVERDGSGLGPDRNPLGSGTPVQVQGQYWKGTATQGANTLTIGRIFVPGTVHRLQPSYNFSEQFGGGNMPELCLRPGFTTRARFYMPTTRVTATAAPTPAGAPDPGIDPNPCPSRQEFVAGQYSYVEQGPQVTGPWPPSGNVDSIKRTTTGKSLEGWSELQGFTGAIQLRVRHNNVLLTDATGAVRLFYTSASTANDVRRYSIPVDDSNGTWCVEANNNGLWGSIGCGVDGTLTSLANAGASDSGTASGTVNVPSWVAEVQVRSVVNGVPGPTAMSAPGAGARNYAVPFVGATPGSTICVEANKHGVWSPIGTCLGTAGGTTSQLSGALTMGATGSGQILGTASISGFSGGILVRSSVGGVVQSSAYTAAGSGSRAFSLGFAASPGQTVCVDANAYGFWTTLGCLGTATINFDSMAGAATMGATGTGQAVGTVNLSGFGGGVQVRTTVDGVAQTASYSASGNGPRSYTTGFSTAPGQSICVEANAYGMWTRSGCRSTATISMSGLSGSATMGTTGTGVANGTVNLSGFSGGIHVASRVGGVGYGAVYSSAGTGSRPFSVAFASSTLNPQPICVEANAYGFVTRAASCMSIPQVLADQTTITRTTASGFVNVPTFNGGVYVEAIVNGVVQPFRYSSAGTGYRSYTVPHSGAVGNVVCVRANAYGYLTTSSPCATVT